MSRSGSSTSTKRTAGASKRPYIWLVGLVLVAVVATVIMALTRDDDTSTDAVASGGVAVAETNEVAIDGAPLPELQDVDTATGLPAPQATGTSLDGDSIELLDRPVVVAYLMITVLMFIVINLIVDIMYSMLDPRVRLKEARG